SRMCEVVHTRRKKFMSKIFAPGVPICRNNHLACAEIWCECLLSIQLEQCRHRSARSAMGREHALLWPGPKVRCRLGQATFAGTDRKDREAPIAALAGGAVQLPGSIPLQAHTEVFLAGRANRRLLGGEATQPGA